MRIFALLSLAALPLIAVSAGAGIANADNDWDDGAHCNVAANAQRLSSQKAIEIGESLGYRIAGYEIDDGCIELEGIDNNGAKVTLRLDPVSGAVLPYRQP